MTAMPAAADISPRQSGAERLATFADRFFVPRRPDLRAWPVDAEPDIVPLSCAPYWSGRGELDVATYATGAGPRVLLIHGWEGQASDMAAFVNPVLRRGASVAGFDLPAHGRSGGERMSIPLAAQALVAVARGRGAFQGVTALSMGGAILVEATAPGLEAGAVALIAPPTHYGRRAREVARMFGLDERQAQTFIDLLSQRAGMPLDDVDMARRAVTLTSPALFVRSRDDRTVSGEEVARAAQAWPGSTHWEVDGLGHRRVLEDPGVVERVVEFVAPVN